MRAVIVWREDSGYGREVASWLREFERRVGKPLESIDPDSVDGDNFRTIYGLMRYPTILALRDDGSVIQMWDGEMLPRIDDVAYYMNQY